jgi:hypothetical protein
MRNERARIDVARDELDRLGDGTPDEAACMLVQTFTETTYPTTAGSFYACHPVSLGGDEDEGSTATIGADASVTVHAWNAGAEVPPSGTTLVIHAIGGRWVFRYDG